MIEFELLGLRLAGVAPLLDGVIPAQGAPVERADGVDWPLQSGGRIVLDISQQDDVTTLRVSLAGVRVSPASLGLRFGSVSGARRYLRNGYHSWDGSWFAVPGTRDGQEPPGKQPSLGFAFTALLPQTGDGAVVLGYQRHDRFQSRFRFGGDAQRMSIDAETLLDHTGETCAETLLLFSEPDVEAALRRWSRCVAAASPLPPRLPSRRITGWCSWYHLYASIDEQTIRTHLTAAQRYRAAHPTPLEIFLIDDGFTPEMGDWLDVKPQFPRGMAPLLAEIAAAGFQPGLWIAPFLVGNRSRLFAEHPDWVVRERAGGAPLVQYRFYGEFRWHKRSEEYYLLDITHPEAAQWMRRVFRTWRQVWGARYFKTDFMFVGAEHGPEQAQWHESGLSRIAIWRRMATLIREEIGDDWCLGSGAPLWASVGLIDAVRIGRDVGVKWSGDQSAESLLRDQSTRNHASGILWQADPDCILLRSRFHDLTDAQVLGLARLAGLTGGVLMTSDRLDELTPERAALLDWLAGLTVQQCSFPSLGREQAGIIEQRVRLADGAVLSHRLDVHTGASELDGLDRSLLDRTRN